MKRDIYLIVGEGRCGKSSLVRALTGIYNGRGRKEGRKIALTTGATREIKIAVWPQSAQEGKKTPTDILNDINGLSDDIPNVLLVLRFEPHIINYWATDYTDLLIKHHNIVGVVTMSSNSHVPELSGFKDALPISSSTENAVNANAEKVRKEWGWL